MSVIEFEESDEVYVVMGIDDNCCDKVLGIYYTFETATKYISKLMAVNLCLDVWIEKHEVK